LLYKNEDDVVEAAGTDQVDAAGVCQEDAGVCQEDAGVWYDAVVCQELVGGLHAGIGAGHGAGTRVCHEAVALGYELLVVALG